jgi:serpin B
MTIMHKALVAATLASAAMFFAAAALAQDDAAQRQLDREAAAKAAAEKAALEKKLAAEAAQRDAEAKKFLAERDALAAMRQQLLLSIEQTRDALAKTQDPDRKEALQVRLKNLEAQLADVAETQKRQAALAAQRQEQATSIRAQRDELVVLRDRLIAAIQETREALLKIQDPDRSAQLEAQLKQLAAEVAKVDEMQNRLAEMAAQLGVAPAALVPARPVVDPKVAAGGANPAASDAAVVADAGNRFALSLYAKLRPEPGNLFFSPESISTALAMAATGARGQTFDQMVAALGLRPDQPIQPEWIARAFGAALAPLRADGPSSGYELAIANSLWGQKGYGFLPDYLAVLKADFGAGLQEVDFAADAEGARKTINAWADKETREKIKDLIPPGVLQPLTRLVLANAIYFKGEWVHKFKPIWTADIDFFVAADKKVTAPIMNQTARFQYADAGDFQALTLPYKGDRLAMMVLLPKKRDGLAEFEQAFSVERLAECLARMQWKDVRVWLPRLKMTRAFMLSKTLAAMGMPLAFQSGQADFSGANGGKEPLWIAEVIHKAFVDVNEEGTEAAAATAVVAPGAKLETEQPIAFRADHPFVFLIRDSKAGAILFMGRVASPIE